MSDCATPKIRFETPTALLQINIPEPSPLLTSQSALRLSITTSR